MTEKIEKEELQMNYQQQLKAANVQCVQHQFQIKFYVQFLPLNLSYPRL